MMLKFEISSSLNSFVEFLWTSRWISFGQYSSTPNLHNINKFQSNSLFSIFSFCIVMDRTKKKISINQIIINHNLCFLCMKQWKNWFLKKNENFFIFHHLDEKNVLKIFSHLMMMMKCQWKKFLIQEHHHYNYYYHQNHHHHHPLMY